MEHLALYAQLLLIVYQEKLLILVWLLLHVYVNNVILVFMEQVPEHAQHVLLWQVVLQQPIKFVLHQEQLIAQHVTQACKLFQTVYIIQAAWQHVQPHQQVLLYVIDVQMDIDGMPQHQQQDMEFVFLVVHLKMELNFIL